MISFSIWLTEKCNMHCLYCYEKDNFTSKNDMPECYDKIVGFIKYISEKYPHDDIIVNFDGGEPLLRFNTLKVLVNLLDSAIDKKRIQYGITTNGTLLNEEIAEYISKKFADISISIDGIKNVHNRNRLFRDGNGSYDKILNNINESGFDKKNIRIRMTLTAFGANYFYDSVQELYKLGFRYIVPAIAVNDIDWTQKKFDQLFENLKRIADSEYSNLSFFQKLVDYKIPLSLCTGGIKTFNIGCDCNIYPCEYVVGIKKFSLGNLFDYKKAYHNGLEYRQIYETVNDGDCVECSYLSFCETSRCKYYNYINNNDLFTPSVNQCQVEHLKYKIWRLFGCH